MGSILAPFRPSGPLCFPVRQRAFSASGGRAAAATGAAGGFYVSLCLIVQTAVQKMVGNYCFSRVSEGTLGSFWARFWRRSVLQGHCVSLSGSVLFQLREEEQQQQQEQQEGSMSHYVSCSALHSTDWASSAVQTCPEFIQRLLVALHLSPFFRGRRQGRQPLNPAMPSGGGG